MNYLLVRLFCIAGLVCSAFASSPAFLPLANGPLGSVTARDGDSAFDAAYYRTETPQGTPAVARLESSVGSEASPLGEGACSIRWTAVVTPARSGVFPVSLRASARAVVSVDGQKLLETEKVPASFGERHVATVELESGRPYAFSVEFFPSGRGGIALEWAEPAPLSRSISTASETVRERAAGPARGTEIGEPAVLENDRYRAEVRSDGSVLLSEKRSSAAAVFEPEFAVVVQLPGQEKRFFPKAGKYLDDGPVGKTGYQVPSWDKETDFLAAALPRVRLRPASFLCASGRLTWSFPAESAFSLESSLELPSDGSEPVLTWVLRPGCDAVFSVGYVGAPSCTAKEASWAWQPLVWQDRRFPNRSYLTLEYECTIPFTMVGAGERTVGVGADPAELPFRMPDYDNSRFGVLVRNASGKLQPQLFAPVLGGAGSRMKAGGEHRFQARLLVARGDWYAAYRRLAQGLYRFHDYRENAECSLNKTIENLTDFVLNDTYCYWFPRYKTWGYQNDAGPGSGRQQSAADALSLALVFDRAEFLDRRARPTLEYMLSRNNQFTKFDKADFMGGSVNYPHDLVASYRLTGSRSTPLRELLEKKGLAGASGRPQRTSANPIVASKAALVEALAAFRLEGGGEALARARTAADRYIALRVARPAESFRDTGSSFWTELAPAYDLLYELYEETGERRYLEASLASLREFSAFVYLVPVVPDGNFVANPGGVYNGQSVPEETVPAWRVAANGLASECGATAHSHRGVFMASYAAWMARVAGETGDVFLRDIARSAIVGRYANYPSYAYRNGYTTLHQKADYPLRSFEEIKKFTSAHYNHPLPMTAFLVDYLVGDIQARSAGAVRFPSDYTATGAYFRNKVYGARPGRFFGDESVWLWLPKGLVDCSSVQLNYLAGRGNGRVYLAFSNQSTHSVSARVSLDASRVSMAGAHHARLWRDGVLCDAVEVRDGRVRIEVSPKGLTCLAIDGAEAKTEIQEAMADASSPPLPPRASLEKNTSFGRVGATAFRLGRGLTTVHVWLEAGPAAVSRARLVADAGDGRRELVSGEFPFEFTLPVPDSARRLDFEVFAQTASGERASGKNTLPLSAEAGR